MEEGFTAGESFCNYLDPFLFPSPHSARGDWESSCTCLREPIIRVNQESRLGHITHLQQAGERDLSKAL